MRAGGMAPGVMGKLAEVIQLQQQYNQEQGLHSAAGGGGGRPPAAAQPKAVPTDATAQELEAMLTELLAAYREPRFQAELAALRQQCFASGSNLLLAMGPVVLRVQAPILQKYGQPPNAVGVDSMKHAVQRRVAEGADEVERLANEARRLLGLEVMPDRSATAETVLAGRLDETAGRLTLSDPQQLQRICRERVEAERDAGALPAASAEHLLELVATSGASAPAVLSLLKMGRHGIHARQLQGLDLPASVPVIEAPSPQDFFQSHVLPNVPAVVRGALGARSFPPLRTFPDLAHLREACGHRRVLVKSLAHEDGSGRPVFVTDPELKLPLAAFLEHLEAFEQDRSKSVPFYLGKVPLRKELPELAQEVADAPSCPQRLYGGCFGKLVPDGVFTYFGCARNTTAVHFDGSENLLLCLSGTKRLWLFPPADARFLYPCADFTRSAAVPFTRWEELSPELQQKFALTKGARPLEVNLRAGDLLYLPACWWHCVEGSEEPNMILNWWFGLHEDKKELARAAR